MKSTLIFVALIAPLSCLAQELHGIVTKVIDGNTIVFSSSSYEDQTVLLRGIDSPDAGQHYAEQAKKFLERLMLNKKVTIVIHGKDRNGNRIGEIKINGNIDPRRELVKEGLAWISERDPNPELEAIKEEARSLGKGLWGEADPTPPWIYRRQQSMLQLKTS